jgi:arylsulfatase A-like enzyme
MLPLGPMKRPAPSLSAALFLLALGAAAWLLLRFGTAPESYRVAHDLTAGLDEAAIDVPRLPLEELFRFEGDGWLFRPNGNIQFSGSSSFWSRLTFFPGRAGSGRGEVSFRYRTQGPGGLDHRLSFVFHESSRARVEVRIESSGRARLVYSEGSREDPIAEAAISGTNGPWRSYLVRVEGARVSLAIDGAIALSSAIPEERLATAALDGLWAIEFSRQGPSPYAGDALFRRLEISRDVPASEPPLQALAFRRDPSFDETLCRYLNAKYSVTRRYVPLASRSVLKQVEIPLEEGRRELLPGLFAPAGSSFRFPLELRPGDRLRLRHGLLHPARASFRVRLSVGGEARVLYESPMRALPDLEEIDLPLPLESSTEAELELSVHSEDALAVGILGSPMVVRRLSRDEPRRPNVIVVSADTLRRDRVGAFDGASASLTPSIDRLAASATVLTRAYSVSPWTTPSHFSLLSGRYPSRHGLNRAFGLNPPAAEDAETLAGILSRHGYVTAAIASDHSLDPTYGFDRGFHSFLDNEVRDVAPLLAPLERFLEEHAREEFFLFLHSYDAHAPLFRGGRMTEEDRRRLGDEVQYNDFLQLGGASPRDRELVKELYDAHVKEYDGAFGRILELLERYEALEDSILVFTSDHGEELFEHGTYQHGHEMWEEVLGVPLIVKFPDGAPFPGRTDSLTGLIDVLPTVLDYLGIELPPGIDGTSFLPVLKGREEARRRFLLAEAVAWGPERKAVITDRYKYVVTFAESDLPWLSPRADTYNVLMDVTPGERLFDLRSDPAERENLVGSEAELAGRLRVLLDPLLEPRGSGGGGLDVDPRRLDALRSLGYIQN